MVFISHSSTDKDKAIRLIRLLKSHGINYWVDHENILPGDNIVAKIRDGLDRANVLVLLISKESSNSPWCSFEYQNVLYDEINSQSKIIIPILIDLEKPPSLLKTKRYVRFFDLFTNDSELNSLLSQLGNFQLKPNDPDNVDITEIIKNVILLLMADRFQKNGVWGRSLIDAAAFYGHAEDPGSITISYWTLKALDKVNSIYFKPFASDFFTYILERRKESGAIGMKKNVGSDYAPKIEIIANNRHTAVGSLFLIDHGKSINHALESIIYVINQRTKTWAWSAMSENIDENADPLTTAYILNSIRHFEKRGILQSLNFKTSDVFIKNYWESGLTWLYENLRKNNDWWLYSTMNNKTPNAEKRKHCYTVDILYHLLEFYNSEEILNDFIDILFDKLVEIWDQNKIGITLGDDGELDLTSTAQFCATCWLIRDHRPDLALEIRKKFLFSLDRLINENKSNSAGWSILLEYLSMISPIQLGVEEIEKLDEKAQTTIRTYLENKNLEKAISHIESDFLKINLKQQLKTIDVIAP
jgi:hypothetical protein